MRIRSFAAHRVDSGGVRTIAFALIGMVATVALIAASL
jgi:hypothetical protein